MVSDLGEKRTLPAIDVPEHPQSIAIAIPATRRTRSWSRPQPRCQHLRFLVPGLRPSPRLELVVHDAGAAPTGAASLSFIFDTSERERFAQLVVLVKGAAFFTWAECLPKVGCSIDGQVVDTSDDGFFFSHAGWRH